MFKKLLSKVGIGSAKIDFVLDQTTVAMGETLQGEIRITGGEVEQNIGKVEIELRVSSYYEIEVADDREKTIKVENTVASIEYDPFVLKPGDSIVEAISFDIPRNIPISSLRTKYFFRSNLEIEQGLDSKDKDDVIILPSGILKNFFQALEQLGMIPKGEIYMGRDQVIGFKPSTWLADQLDELVFQYDAHDTEHKLHGSFEIDKKAKGFKGILMDGLDLDEKRGSFFFGSDQLDSVEKAKETIQQFVCGHLKSIK